jgi:hypothetical protein
MDDSTGTPTDADTGGMRVMFWAWILIVILGLAAMMVLPLAGR